MTIIQLELDERIIQLEYNDIMERVDKIRYLQVQSTDSNFINKFKVVSEDTIHD